MPFAPTSPASVQIPTNATVAQDVDEFHILEMRIELVPNDPNSTKVHVEWAEGYDDSGTFKARTVKRATLEGANLNSYLSQMCTASNSRFDEIKQALWALLELEGHVSSGTVS